MHYYVSKTLHKRFLYVQLKKGWVWCHWSVTWHWEPFGIKVSLKNPTRAELGYEWTTLISFPHTSFHNTTAFAFWNGHELNDFPFYQTYSFSIINTPFISMFQISLSTAQNQKSGQKLQRDGQRCAPRSPKNRCWRSLTQFNTWPPSISHTEPVDTVREGHSFPVFLSARWISSSTSIMAIAHWAVHIVKAIQYRWKWD